MPKYLWIITCDEDGVKSEPMLHYWDVEVERWERIPTAECKTWEYDAARYNRFIKEM